MNKPNPNPVPMFVIILGMIVMIAGVATAVIVPQATVSLGVGQYTWTVTGISPLGAMLLFTGGLFAIVGSMMYVAMARSMTRR